MTAWVEICKIEKKGWFLLLHDLISPDLGSCLIVDVGLFNETLYAPRLLVQESDNSSFHCVNLVCCRSFQSVTFCFVTWRPIWGCVPSPVTNVTSLSLSHPALSVTTDSIQVRHLSVCILEIQAIGTLTFRFHSPALTNPECSEIIRNNTRFYL